MVFDPHDKAALRQAPEWERWQHVRMPETIDEANAAIVLVTMKRDTLEAKASLAPERDAELQFAADQWAAKLVELEYARELLRAGTSPLSKKHAELQQRHAALVRLASECPDTRALIDTLLLRIQRAHDMVEEQRVERSAYREAARGLEAETKGLRAAIISRNQEIVDLKAVLTVRLAEKNKEIDTLKVSLAASSSAALIATNAYTDLAHLRATVANQKAELARLHARAAAPREPVVSTSHAAPMAPETRARFVETLRANDARLLFIVAALAETSGVHTSLTQYMTGNARETIPAGYYDRWVAETLPKIRAKMAERDAEDSSKGEADDVQRV